MTLLPSEFVASDREDGQLLHCARSCSPPPASPKLQLTLRAVLVGLFVGTILCFTNMYFGLQTGWVTMGSLQCAMVGFAILKYGGAAHFNPLENVVVQTVGVATATMPLAGGFVGIIPALQLLDPPVRLTVGEQLAWCAALTYFGIFFAVPLRRQTILVEKLPFPSGTATSKLIEMLHSATAAATGGGEGGSGGEGGEGDEGRAPLELQARWRTLGASFGLSFGVALLGFFVPPLANLKVFTWVCLPTLSAWHWTLRPSLSYVGQGIIMGPRSALSMLGGALAAWALLGPLAVWRGWVASVPYEGPERAWCATPRVEAAAVDSWEGGAQGWTLWVAMGLMLGEAVTSFGIILALQLRPAAPTQRGRRGEPALSGSNLPREMTTLPSTLPCAAAARQADRADVDSVEADWHLPDRASDESSSADADEPTLEGARGARDRLEVAPPSELVPTAWWVGGLVLSVALCVAVLSPLFRIPAWQIGTSALLACLIAVLAVRALGQTDLNPVSAVGKLSQILFALLAPGHVVTNIVAGALAEAGAMQAGDLMQDLKTGHLLGASPRAQFLAQLVGSTASIVVTVAAFNLYATAYGCQATAAWSCEQFQVPAAC